MSVSRWAKVKVLDKSKSTGWLFGNSYHIVLRLCEEGMTHHGSQIVETACNADNYYGMDIGKEYNIRLYQHSNGLWYPVSE